MDALIILSRLVHFAALCYLVGGALFWFAVAAISSPRGNRIAAASIAVLSSLGWFAGVAAQMTGGWPELLGPDTLAAVLTETRFGWLWCIRLALLAALLGIAFMQPGRRITEILILAVGGAALASLAGAGHGVAGPGSFWVAHVIADGLHLLCAAAWLGGLASLWLLLRRDDALTRIPGALPCFSRIGYASVALLLVTGCINTASIVSEPTLLLTGEYGRVLLLKVILVMVMVAMAIANRVVLAPQLRPESAHPDALRALRTSVAVEQAMGLAVLAIVALLGTIHPGR